MATFLSRLPDADRTALAARWDEHVHGPGELIIAQDDRGGDVFFVLEGRARATVFSPAGREVAYRLIGAGDIFGELAAIDGESRSANIVALEEIRVARLSPAALRELVDTRPSFAWVLLAHLSAQVRRMSERVYEVSTLVVRKRLIRELLRLAQAPADPDGLARIRPAPTHSEIAASISTHREAVSREMSALSKRKLVEKRDGALVLRDIRALQALAASDDDWEA